MSLLLERPENSGALRYLAHGRSPDEAGFGPPPADLDRWHLGTHPEVVARLWDVLNASLPEDARTLVFDGPALMHPTGIILAAGMGTQYVLRLLVGDRDAAIAAGAEVLHHFRTVGTSLNLPTTFGLDWVFGHYDEREPAWLLASYRSFGGAGSTAERASL
ncbi:MAG: hypothetical protein ACXWMG_04810 [Candidatus Limnocylindria bacterium]